MCIYTHTWHNWDFPGGPVVKILCFHCRGDGSNPWSGQILHNLCCVRMLVSVQHFCDPMNCSPPGSSVHGTFQARILEWVAISSSGGFPNPGIEPASAALLADSFLWSHWGSPFLFLNHYK